jgi:hypothetical protein
MKNLKSILGAIAPTLATAMGGPLGGMAMKMVADRLGLPDATPEAVDAAVAAATPEQLAEIKKVEADFKVQMKALDVDLVMINVAVGWLGGSASAVISYYLAPARQQKDQANDIQTIKPQFGKIRGRR